MPGSVFFWFNAPPAQVFMGDTGSLALGGMLGTIAVATKHEIVLAIVGGLFVAGGFLGDHPGRLPTSSRANASSRWRRSITIFEKLGWTEPQIVIRFWIIAVVLAMIGLGDAEAEMRRSA